MLKFSNKLENLKENCEEITETIFPLESFQKEGQTYYRLTKPFRHFRNNNKPYHYFFIKVFIDNWNQIPVFYTKNMLFSRNQRLSVLIEDQKTTNLKVLTLLDLKDNTSEFYGDLEKMKVSKIKFFGGWFS